MSKYTNGCIIAIIGIIGKVEIAVKNQKWKTYKTCIQYEYELQI